MRKKNATTTEVNKRIIIVKDLILSDFDNPEIIQYCKDNFKITEQQGYNYIRKAWGIIFDTEIYPSTKDKLKWRIHSLKMLKKRVMNAKDYRTALAGDKEINELLGLHNKDLRVTHENEQKIIVEYYEAGKKIG